MKGKALRRALQTNDIQRLVGGAPPLITDETEWITKDKALQYLEKNTLNRRITMGRVEEYAQAMRDGRWKFHGQGIMFDAKGNLLTGQKRLWALVFSGLDGIYMRVSRGNPCDVAHLIDRGNPQTASDLSSRKTGRRHLPVEASIARAICALNGTLKPSTDDLALAMEVNAEASEKVLTAIAGTRKTKAVVMILAAMVDRYGLNAARKALDVESKAALLEAKLSPQTAKDCWGKGAAFGLAMKYAAEIA